jgi:polysaccharide export outer membrane protein
MLKKILVLVTFFIAGCTVPGTYMGVSDFQKPVNVDGRFVNPKIIPINSQLFNKANEQFFIGYNRPFLYQVGPYDVLDITVWNHPELSFGGARASTNAGGSNYDSLTSYNVSNIVASNVQTSGITVDAHGEIFFPFINKVKISGLTVDQVRETIATKLKRYIRDPQISVQVVGFNSQKVYIIGEINKPLTQPLTDRPMSMLEAINAAGNVAQMSADTKHLYVIRDTLPKVTVFWLDARDPQAVLLASHFQLANNDIVYASPAGITSWNRLINQLLPSIQTYWFARSIVKDRY